MKHIILATLLVFSCGTLQAEHKNGGAHDYTKSFTVPKLQLKCHDGFEFAIVQTASQLKSYQVMGENGLPLLCGSRKSDHAALTKARAEKNRTEAEAHAKKQSHV